MSPAVKRVVLWGPLIVLVAVGLWRAFRAQPVAVDLATVSLEPMMVSVSEEGMTRIHDVYVLSAPVAGSVRRIDFHVGDPVVAGESVLAEIEPGDPTLLDPRSELQAQAAVEAAEAAKVRASASVEESSAEFEFARAELSRASELAIDELISRRALEDAERTFKTSKAAVSKARAELQMRLFELEQARAQLLSPNEARGASSDCECVPIMSPVSGRILRIFNRSKRAVALSEPLIEIGEPTDLEVVVDFLSSDAVRIRAGQRAILDGWGGSAPLEGRVRSVEPFGFTKVSALGIEEQRVNVIVDLDGAATQWERLGHGYLIEAKIVLWESNAVLTVPLTSLFRSHGEWAVFREEGGRAVLTSVKLGRRNGLVAEVLSALSEGDAIVVHPSDRVRDGVLITARSAD